MSLDSHLLLMVLYAGGTAAFFALLWRDEQRDRWKLFAIIFVALLAGGILTAVLMQRTFVG